MLGIQTSLFEATKRSVVIKKRVHTRENSANKNNYDNVDLDASHQDYVNSI